MSTNGARRKHQPLIFRSLRAHVAVGSGEIVRLRSLTFVCVAQAGMALLMGAFGAVGSDTVIPACYFSFSTFVGAWLMRDKPNTKMTHAVGVGSGALLGAEPRLSKT